MAQPVILPCELTFPNRLVKRPMQEALATPPLYDFPLDKFQNWYNQ